MREKEQPIMSQQQMNFDETNRQRQEPPIENYETGYRDPFINSYGGGLKLSPQGSGSNSSDSSLRVRMILAIVSIVMLVPISGIVLGIASGTGPFGLIGGLIALGLICITIIAVNIAFNWRR
jgi:hypothetical protein